MLELWGGDIGRTLLGARLSQSFDRCEVGRRLVLSPSRVTLAPIVVPIVLPQIFAPDLVCVAVFVRTCWL